MARYDLDNPERGALECPKCRFTMEPLRGSSRLDSREGYLLDDRVRWSVNDNIITSYLFGSVSLFLWLYVLEPLSYKLFGDWKSRRYRRILREYPHSRICPHCAYLARRK